MPVTPDRLLAWMRLARVPGFGPVLVKRVVEALGSPEAALGAPAARLAEIEGIGRQRAEAFARGVPVDLVQRELDAATKKGVRILCADDPDWPPGLRRVPDPPIVLYLRGNLEPTDAIAVGIVGSRKCTLYGREQAERFGALLAQAGICVVSGGARGIDTGAHQGALRAKGRTVVVQGCGAAFVYPEENADLYDRIADGRGAILSELPLDVSPKPENFPPRNRIIAGMSLGILVIEATLRSGSLITARLAADDYGREVFALPGRVDVPTSAGTHHLIKIGGASLVESADDILAALGELGAELSKQQPAQPAQGAQGASGPQATLAFSNVDAEPESPPPAAFTPPQQKILAALDTADHAGIDIDGICDHSGLPAAVIMAELTMLQIRGAVRRAAGQRFSRTANSGRSAS
jgi:DNA processing protein